MYFREWHRKGEKDYHLTKLSWIRSLQAVSFNSSFSYVLSFSTLSFLNQAFLLNSCIRLGSVFALWTQRMHACGVRGGSTIPFSNILRNKARIHVLYNSWILYVSQVCAAPLNCLPKTINAHCSSHGSVSHFSSWISGVFTCVIDKMGRLFGSCRFLDGKYKRPTIVAGKEGREAAGFESSFKESSDVQRLGQSVSRFDMRVAKANPVPGKGCDCSVSSWRKYRSHIR